MGLRDAIRRLAPDAKASEIQSFTTPASSVASYSQEFGRWLDQTMQFVEHRSTEQLFRDQPYLRMVVTFLARNIAQLGLQTFQRVSETDRVRLRDDPMSLLLSRPNRDQTAYELIYTLVADLALYDIAYWWITEDTSTPSGYSLRPLPPAWVSDYYGGDLFAPAGIVVTAPNGGRIKVPTEQVITFHGWNPGEPSAGSSPINALKDILKEQISAWAYRQQVWDRGGRVSAVLTRPAGAPKWSDPARERFSADWKSRYSDNDGTNAGGTPILEDGMTLERLNFSAREDEWLNVAKLSLATVAGVYHVNPTMVGLLDNANYSNVREFRRMLYGDTLGPTMAMIEDRINTFLLPLIGDLDGRYVEFNIAEKLQGSFEEQASALSTLVGAPVMTRNEGRSKLNLPQAEGGDELITPLNVIEGGQASPTDSAPPKAAHSLRVVAPKEGS